MSGFFSEIASCLFQNYANFHGRASRGQFLAFFIFSVFFWMAWSLMLLGLINYFGDINLIDFVLLYVPFLLVAPFISVCVRRFHDCGKSGWLFLLLLVPVINFFGFYILCKRGDKGSNRYGAKAPVSRWR